MYLALFILCVKNCLSEIFLFAFLSVTLGPMNPTGGTKIVQNEGFFRADLGSQGLSCEHSDAKCDDFLRTSYSVPFGVMVGYQCCG